jgi:hypothetical protein
VYSSEQSDVDGAAGIRCVGAGGEDDCGFEWNEGVGGVLTVAELTIRETTLPPWRGGRDATVGFPPVEPLAALDRDVDMARMMR